MFLFEIAMILRQVQNGFSIQTEWTFPFVAEESHAPLLVEWLIEGSDEAVFGAVNDTIVGAGERSSIETNFLAQTFTFVPEPSSLSLLLLGGLLTLRRERKSV